MRRTMGLTGSLIHYLFEEIAAPDFESIFGPCEMVFPNVDGIFPDRVWGWHYTRSNEGPRPTYRLRQARQHLAVRKMSARPSPQPLKLPATERTRQRTPVLYAARARWKQLRRKTN